MKIVLASESASRRRAMDILGLIYEVHPSRIDEKAIREEDPDEAHNSGRVWGGGLLTDKDQAKRLNHFHCVFVICSLICLIAACYQAIFVATFGDLMTPPLPCSPTMIQSFLFLSALSTASTHCLTTTRIMHPASLRDRSHRSRRRRSLLA